MFLFKSNVFGWNTSNENFLRVHLRHLFLDHCENQLDQALWLSYITDYSNELAQVIMLLYSPMNESEGKHQCLQKNLLDFLRIELINRKSRLGFHYFGAIIPNSHRILRVPIKDYQFTEIDAQLDAELFLRSSYLRIKYKQNKNKISLTYLNNIIKNDC